MTGSLVLRNARLLDPLSGEYTEGDLRCDSGRIVEVRPGLAAADVRSIDVRGAVVLPGLVDAAPAENLIHAGERGFIETHARMQS